MRKINRRGEEDEGKELKGIRMIKAVVSRSRMLLTRPKHSMLDIITLDRKKRLLVLSPFSSINY